MIHSTDRGTLISTSAGEFPVRPGRHAGAVAPDDPVANCLAAVLFALDAMTPVELADLVVDLGSAVSGIDPAYRPTLRALVGLAAVVADRKG